MSSVPKYPLSLEEAKQATDGYVVITGDYGGVCYLVCPARLVQCGERELLFLAHDIDGIFGGSTEGASVGYVRLSIGERATSLGGVASSTLWLPRWISHAGLEGKINQVLAGKLNALNLSPSDYEDVRVSNREMRLRGETLD
jgi:hypothetical protein